MEEAQMLERSKCPVGGIYNTMRRSPSPDWTMPCRHGQGIRLAADGGVGPNLSFDTITWSSTQQMHPFWHRHSTLAAHPTTAPRHSALKRAY